MTEIVENFVHEHLYAHIVIIAICLVAIMGAMIIDLITGVSKARKRGEATTSQGLKKTATKALKYFTPLIALMFVDIICCVVVTLPAFTMLWSAYCVFCEFISIREKSWQKEEIRKAEKTMSVVIENKDDIAKVLSELVFQAQKGGENEGK